MKTYIYQQYEQNGLFHEQIQKELVIAENQTINPVEKLRTMNDVERLALFMRALNRLGEEGWQYHSNFVFARTTYILFYKEVYKKG